MKKAIVLFLSAFCAITLFLTVGSSSVWGASDYTPAVRASQPAVASGDTGTITMQPAIQLVSYPLDVSYYFSVPHYKSDLSNLEWAFCQVMAENYHKDLHPSKSVAAETANNLAKEKFGSLYEKKLPTWNKSSFPEHSGFTVPDPSSKDGLLDLHLILKERGPIYGYYYHTDPGGGVTTGHCVVIAGVNFYKRAVLVKDPNRTSVWQPYEEFLTTTTTGEKMQLKYYVFPKYD